MSEDSVFKPDLSFVFQPPFAPTGEEEGMCVCVHCGEKANADHRISTYPHRYIPKKWEIEGFSRGLRCWSCSTRTRSDFSYFQNHLAWVSPEHKHVTSEPLETETMGTKFPAKEVTHGNPNAPVSEPVDGGHSEVPAEAHGRLLSIRSSLDHLFFEMPHSPEVDRNAIGLIRSDVYRTFDVVQDNMDAAFKLCGILRAYAVALLNATVDGEKAYSYGADLRVFNHDWGSNFFTCQRNESWLDHFLGSLDWQAQVIQQGVAEMRRKEKEKLFSRPDEPATPGAVYVGVRPARTAFDDVRPVAVFDADGFVRTTRRGARMTNVKKQAVETAQAVGMGMQLAAANEAGEILVDLASELFSDNLMAQAMLKHPDGRELAKMLMAMLLQTGAEQTNMLPNPEAISHICKLQLTQSTSTLVAPRLKKVRRHLTKLAKLGNTVGAAADAASPLRARVSDDLDDLDDVREQNAVLQEQLKLMREEMDEIRNVANGGKKKKERTAG